MKAIIVEDERFAREELAYLIQEHSSIEITHCFEDGLDVLKFLQENETDAVFLDINIPSLDGMLLAGSISKFRRKPYIIFTTAYKEHAAKAFELEAFDYILKPYDEKRIATVLARLEHAFQERQPAVIRDDAVFTDRSTRPYRINLRKAEKIVVKHVNNIYYAEAREKNTLVYTDDDVYTMPMSLSEFAAMLPDLLFFRCHRSYIVNLSKIREIVPWFNQTYLVRLHDLKAEVPVSRSNLRAFRKRMHLE
ncbi:LytTR family DNA-binding domain-containing protein [Sporolactobacillus sp. CPB3-1]|uniref:LytTR family DNA-binding domain-containing protein n=1 Tax=Sporolactobacillus mangiferae TaxID=2940498 RepID=A0ABT0MDZ4_9BACL|nr:LytTR family DNA-binding domain-containing protein [Sporolactobacillus mangiferae]MCL1632903.1 LytTR family DNA-binding domain-containing protein [Sporolactobacillus mangiferae]